MTTSFGSWVDGSGGGTPILAADLNNRDMVLAAAGGAAIIPPTSANAKDDEFDGTSSVTWSDTPTAPQVASHNSVVPGALRLQSQTNNAWVGRVQSVPGAYPYTITTRISLLDAYANYMGGGIVLAPASPTGSSTIMGFVAYYGGGTVFDRWTGTFGGTFSSETTLAGGFMGRIPIYLQAVVNSATSVNLYISNDGVQWTTHSTANPGFTPALMGLIVTDSAGSTRHARATFDFFRVT